jgi:adenosylhomocysteinase
MDMSFAVQAYGALYIKEHKDELPKHLIKIPEEIDKMIASRRLAAWGIEIDTLTEEQEAYLNSWQL